MFFNRKQPEIQAARMLAQAAGASAAPDAGDASLPPPPPSPSLAPTSHGR